MASSGIASLININVIDNDNLNFKMCYDENRSVTFIEISPVINISIQLIIDIWNFITGNGVKRWDISFVGARC